MSLIVLFITFIYIASDNVQAKGEMYATANDTELVDGTVSLPCKSGQVLNGSTCINVTECTKPVLSGGQCLKRCPDGYLYFTMDTKFNDDFMHPGKFQYTIADIKDNPCVKQTTIWLLLGSVAAANVIYFLFIWMFLSTRKFSTQTLKSWFARFKQRRFQRDGASERLVNAGDDDDDDDDCIRA